jgi:superoxide dismutase, Cu-Zn family
VNSTPKVACAFVLVAIAACARTLMPEPQEGVARLTPTRGNSASGIVTFREGRDNVIVIAELVGLPPNSSHAIHVHERGNCEAPDASSAGAHFNPRSQPHGEPPEIDRHAGDMPNILSDEHGRARYRAELNLISVAPGPLSVIDKAVVLHARPDDYRSQPAGNAGDRVACGVVQATG